MVTAARRRTPKPAVALDDALHSFVRALRGRNASPHTIKSYEQSIGQLTGFAIGTGHAATLGEVARPVIEDFLAQVIATRSSATAETRYDGLKAFHQWLVEVEELEAENNPMLHIRRPKAPIRDVDLVTADEVKRMLRCCAGQGLLDRRDRALILLLWDSGVRVGGLVSMRTDKTDLDERLATVRLKGGKEHTIFFGAKTAAAIDRYLWGSTRPPDECAAQPVGWAQGASYRVRRGPDADFQG